VAVCNERSIAFFTLGGPSSTHTLRARQFASELTKVGWQTLVIYPDKFKRELGAAENDLFIKTGEYPIAFASGNPRHLLADCKNIVKEFRPRWLHFLNPELKAMLVSGLVRGPKVVGDWEDWHCLYREKGWRKWRLRLVDRWMRRRCDRVITCSKWLQNRFCELGRADAGYIPYAELPLEIPDRANPFTTPTAVYMGSLQPHWDHRVVLQAAQVLALRGKYPAIEIIGTGEDLEDCEKFCSENGLSNVHFAGFLPWDDMLNRLRWAETLLFPIELNEQNLARCPFKVFQYAKVRRPIITCDVGEVRTFLKNKATYVPCTPAAFAHALENKIGNARESDVDYEIEQQTWSDRAMRLATCLNS
jgi:glycosyltransferase involved in cell wall biosynthesis